MENKIIKERPNFLQRLWIFIKEVCATDWFEPHSSFLKLKSFWVPFLTIFSIFIVLCVKVVFEQKLKIDFVEWTVTNMYEWFKIPLWVLALMIPVIGLFNANHKSEQTKESMRLTGEQNRFSNYYKHVEEFVKHSNHIQEQFKEYDFKVIARRFHAMLYLESKNGSFHANQKLIETCRQDVLHVIDLIRIIRSYRFQEGASYRQAIANLTISIKANYGYINSVMTCKRALAAAIDVSNGSLIIKISDEEIEAINTWFFMHMVTIRLLEFDPNIKTYSKVLEEVRNHFKGLRNNSALSKLEEIRHEHTVLR